MQKYSLWPDAKDKSIQEFNPGRSYENFYCNPGDHNHMVDSHSRRGQCTPRYEALRTIKSTRSSPTTPTQPLSRQELDTASREKVVDESHVSVCQQQVGQSQSLQRMRTGQLPKKRIRKKPIIGGFSLHCTGSDTLCNGVTSSWMRSSPSPSKQIEGVMKSPKHRQIIHIDEKTDTEVNSMAQIASTIDHRPQYGDGSWLVSNAKSASKREFNVNSVIAEARAFGKDYQMQLYRLLDYMEYVVTSMKQNMSPTAYGYNKALFQAKILSHYQLQYGHHQDEQRYIRLGAGEFGEVLYGRVKSTGQLVAVKALKKRRTDMGSLMQEAFMYQIASNSGYSPSYIGLAPISLTGFMELSIVMEFIGDPAIPSPYEFRRALKRVKESKSRQKPLLLEWVLTSIKMARAVGEFHSLGLLINDVKVDNILLKPNGIGYQPIFVDFGLASLGKGITLALKVNDSNRSKILSEHSHIAPEVLFGGETTVKSDIYSLGKALMMIADTFENEALKSVIDQCLSWNTADRPTPHQLMTHLSSLATSLT